MELILDWRHLIPLSDVMDVVLRVGGECGTVWRSAHTKYNTSLVATVIHTTS